MATVSNHRRYCLAKRKFHEGSGDPNADGLARVWRAKQEAIASTALPVGFPSLAQLTAAGYTTEADLEGADEDELVALGLTSQQALEVLAAL